MPIIERLPSPRYEVSLHKWMKTLHGLAIAEFSLGFIAFIISIAGLIVSSSIGNKDTKTWMMGFMYMGFAISIFAMIVGGLGISALATVGSSRKRLAVAHFVICIFAALVDLSATIVWAIQGGMTSSGSTDPYLSRGQYVGWGVMSWLLSMLFLTHMICSILSTAFMCCNWCCMVMVMEQSDQLSNGDQIPIVLGNTHPAGNDYARMP